jgi:hypothetical protein
MYLFQTLKEEGYEIILGGDFNEKQSTNNIISYITDKMNMKELLRKFGKQDKSTYIRGSSQINKIFCTKNLKNKQGQEKEIKDMIKEKKSMIRKFRQYNQQSYKIRHEEMEEKIMELEKEKSTDEPKIRRLKMILHTERTKLTYKKIKGQIKRNQNQDGNKIQVVQCDGSIIKYTKSEEMAKQVEMYNKTHIIKPTALL